MDDDDDGDGWLDTDEAMDQIPTTLHHPIDTDLMEYNSIDDDDDDDGWLDTTEILCGTNTTDFENYPLDTDSDGICDSEDLDDDGDGYNDSVDQSH